MQPNDPEAVPRAEVPQIEPAVKEWRSVKFYRALVRVYMKILRYVSSDTPQKVMTASAILGIHGLGITCFMITVLNPRIPFAIDNVMQVIGFNILVLTVLYFYTIKNLFEKEVQPICAHIMVPLLSFSLFSQNIALAILLEREGYTISQKAAIGVLFLNFIAVYYLFWLVLAIVAGMMFFIEFLVRLVTCRLTQPINPNIKLPALFYPILPALVNIDILIPEGTYVSSEHANHDCIICMKTFEEGDSIKQLRCHSDHIFHTDCLHQWLCVKLTCPICRTPIN